MISTKIIIVLLFCNFYSEKELKSLAIFFRHGAREYLSKLSKYNPKPNIGLGELNKLGLREHYILGKQLYLRHKSFFDQLKSKNIFAVASHIIRVQQSLFANFRGLFYKNKGYQIPLVFKKDDRYFFYEENYCKNLYNKSQDLLFNNLNKLNDSKFFDYYISLMKNNEIFKKYYKDKINSDISMKDFYMFDDLLIAFNYNNYGKERLSQTLINKLNDYVDFFYSFYFLVKIRTNNYKYVYKKIIKTFKKYFKTKENYYTVFSGHDSNIMALLNLLVPDHQKCVLNYFKTKYFEKKEPSFNCLKNPFYASALTWELYERKNKKHCISFKYDNKIIELIKGKKCLSFKKFKKVMHERLIKNNIDHEKC